MRELFMGPCLAPIVRLRPDETDERVASINHSSACLTSLARFTRAAVLALCLAGCADPVDFVKDGSALQKAVDQKLDDSFVVKGNHDETLSMTTVTKNGNTVLVQFSHAADGNPQIIVMHDNHKVFVDPGDEDAADQVANAAEKMLQ